MTQPFLPCTISAQSRNNEFLTTKTVVRKPHQNNGHTGSSCLDKAVLVQGGGGVRKICTARTPRQAHLHRGVGCPLREAPPSHQAFA